MRSIKGVIVLGVIAGLALLSGCAPTRMQVKEEEKEEMLFPPYYGPKKRIAVMGFEDKVPRNTNNISLFKLLFGGATEGANIGTGMSDMLTTALVKTQRFIVVERQNIDDVLKEQRLGASGAVRDETAAKIGEILGAQVLIRGAVTEFQERSEGGAGGIGIRGFGLGIQVSSAHVAIDLKIYDATTGVVLEAKNIEKKISETGLALAGRIKGITFGGGGFQKTPVGKAVRECIEEAVEYVVSKMEKMPWQGRIVEIREGRVYINAGENTNIKPGTRFVVYRPGEELIDPETGLSLGSEITRVGIIQVETVDKKFSIASVTQGSNFRRNDIIKLQ